MNDVLNEKTLCFLASNRFKSDYNLCDFKDYLIENYSAIDIDDCKKNFIILHSNGADITSILNKFIAERIPDNDFPEASNKEEMVSNNYNYFYTIEVDNTDESIMISLEN